MGSPSRKGQLFQAGGVFKDREFLERGNRKTAILLFERLFPNISNG